MITVRVFTLPRRKLFESAFDYSKRLEKEIEQLCELIPDDYHVPAKIVKTQIAGNPPRLVFFDVELEIKEKGEKSQK